MTENEILLDRTRHRKLDYDTYKASEGSDYPSILSLSHVTFHKS